MKRRRLGDLFVRGAEVAVSDGQGEPIVVWIAKLNEIDREAVIRRASAAKARYLIDTDNEDSETFQSMYSTVREFDDRDGLVRIIIGDEVRRFRLKAEAELAADEDTWAKDGYLQGLVDSWVGTDDEPGLARAIAEDPEDPEALKVQAEIDKFEAQVRELVTAETDRLETGWASSPDDVLWRSATHELLKRRSEEAFLKEAERQQLFYGVREAENHRTRYFTAIADVDELDAQVTDQLNAAYNKVAVDSQDVKSWPATQDSSVSSESPGAETSDHSGLTVVSA